jgi:hypothetical protein
VIYRSSGFTVSPVERRDDNSKHMVLVEYLYVLLWNSGVAGVSLRLKLGVIRRFYAKKLPDNESSRPLFFLCVYGLSQWQHSVYQWNVWLMVWKCMVNPEKIRIEVTDQFGLNFSFKMIIYWFMQQNWCCFFFLPRPKRSANILFETAVNVWNNKHRHDSTNESERSYD